MRTTKTGQYNYLGQVKCQECDAEFKKISDSILTLDVLYDPPIRPFDGLLAGADGGTWNPGKGAGVYFFHKGKWRHISESGY